MKVVHAFLQSVALLLEFPGPQFVQSKLGAACLAVAFFPPIMKVSKGLSRKEMPVLMLAVMIVEKSVMLTPDLYTLPCIYLGGM